MVPYSIKTALFGLLLGVFVLPFTPVASSTIGTPSETTEIAKKDHHKKHYNRHGKDHSRFYVYPRHHYYRDRRYYPYYQYGWYRHHPYYYDRYDRPYHMYYDRDDDGGTIYFEIRG